MWVGVFLVCWRGEGVGVGRRGGWGGRGGGVWDLGFGVVVGGVWVGWVGAAVASDEMGVKGKRDGFEEKGWGGMGWDGKEWFRGGRL